MDLTTSFKGNDKRYIYDRKDVRDDLLTQLNEAITFIMKHLNVRSEIHGINRQDIFELPLDALREALVNTIVHRDYSMRGTSIYVKVYDKMMIIVSLGGVPSGITKANFGKESIRRNIITAQEDKADNLSDPALLDRATSLQRALFTFDDDLLAEAAQRQQKGIVFAGVIYAHPL